MYQMVSFYILETKIYPFLVRIFQIEQIIDLNLIDRVSDNGTHLSMLRWHRWTWPSDQLKTQKITMTKKINREAYCIPTCSGLPLLHTQRRQAPLPASLPPESPAEPRLPDRSSPLPLRVTRALMDAAAERGMGQVAGGRAREARCGH
jgi:hypothetical protein